MGSTMGGGSFHRLLEAESVSPTPSSIDPSRLYSLCVPLSPGPKAVYFFILLCYLGASEQRFGPGGVALRERALDWLLLCILRGK